MGWTSDNATTGIVIPARIFMYLCRCQTSELLYPGASPTGGGVAGVGTPHF